MISREWRDYLELQAQKHHLPDKEKQCFCTHALHTVAGISWICLNFQENISLEEIPLQRTEAKMRRFNNAVAIKELNHSGLYHNGRVQPEAGKKYLIRVIWSSDWLWFVRGIKQMTSETLCSPGFWCFYDLQMCSQWIDWMSPIAAFKPV